MTDSEQNKRKNVRNKRFATLSALTQHLETGACRGGAKMLKRAVGYVEEQLRELGFDLDWARGRALLLPGR